MGATAICATVCDQPKSGYRMDAAAFRGAPERTQQGFMKVRAGLSSVGVFEYENPDGSKRRELRPPDEVFAAESIASLAHAPLTIMHKGGLINPSNVQRESAGVVVPASKHEPGVVLGDVIVQRQDAIDSVIRKELYELSPGYDALEMEWIPGRWDGKNYGPHVKTGEPYDVVQRKIRYNHVTLMPPNGGRQGAKVALRMDGADGAMNVALFGADGGETPPKGESTVKINVRFDGIDYPVDVADALAPTFQSHINKLETDRTKLASDLTSLNTRFDARDKEAIALKAQLDAATDPVKLNEMVEELTTVRMDAISVLVESGIEQDEADKKVKGKTLPELKTLVVSTLQPELRMDGKSADYVGAAYDALVAQRKNGGGLARDREQLPSLGGGLRSQRMDAKDDPADADAARERMLKRNREGSIDGGTPDEGDE